MRAPGWLSHRAVGYSCVTILSKVMKCKQIYCDTAESRSLVKIQFCILRCEPGNKKQLDNRPRAHHEQFLALNTQIYVISAFHFSIKKTFLRATLVWVSEGSTVSELQRYVPSAPS